MNETEYDLIINGGGLVGASLACALAGQGLRIAVVEAVPFAADAQPSFDERVIALAPGTQQILQSLGLWQAIGAESTPIHTIHVSDRGRFGFSRLTREEQQVAALGFVVPARVLGRVLLAHVALLPDVDWLCPARLLDFTVDDEWARVEIEAGEEQRRLSARLLIAADGAHSPVREQLGIDTRTWEYGQHAVIANVQTSKPHAHIAYERFTDTGPLALLPMQDRQCSLVWTVRDDQVDDLLALDDDEFLARLQERFGFRLGRFEKVGRRMAHPLRLVRALECVRPRIALLGNAVHTLHPVAGQGFNLGMRDVAALAEVLSDAIGRGNDPGEDAVLRTYADWRKGDQRRVVAFTDVLVRVFSSPLAPLACARDLGLLGFDLVPPAKHLFATLTMGRGGRLTRLARGLPLRVS